MRCPKCGYNSFDHLDSCKKCGKDLTEHKQKFGIVSVLFPGQMKPSDQVAVEEESVVEEVAAVAAPVAAAAVVTGEAASEGAADFSVVDEPAATETSESDDFGFDFMSDSEEEEDLSFDELFEEAPVDEDVEESLPSPEAAEEDVDEFSFDMETAEDSVTEDVAELEDDFGFDPTDGSEDVAPLDSDIFDEDDEFSFDNDTIEFEDSEKKGDAEDPKDPFDLPESSLQERAPEELSDLAIAEPEAISAVIADENELQPDLLAEEQADLLDLASSGSVEPEPADETVDETFLSGTPDAGPSLSERLEEDEPPKKNAFTETQPVVDSVLTIGGLASSEPESLKSAEGLVEDEPIPSNVFEDSAKGDVVAGISESTEKGLLPATGNRVVAFSFDLLLLAVVGICFVMAAEAAISTSGNGLFPSLETLLDLSIPYFLVLFSLAFGYFTLFHFLAGQTPGKMLAGLRVETVAGEPLLFSQAFLRSVGGLLQVLPIGLGYLVILASPDRRGWNDRLAGTRLISLRGGAEEA